jgi:hypothetical protein
MSRKVFHPTPTLPLLRGGSKKFTNHLGLLYNQPDFFASRASLFEESFEF